MTRPGRVPAARVVAALLSALFLAGGVLDSADLHACPRHDALPPAAGQVGAPPAGDAPEGAVSGSRAPDDTGACCCVGPCTACGGAARTALGSRAADRPGGPAVVRLSGRPAAAGDAGPEPYRLPYPNAPPSAG